MTKKNIFITSINKNGEINIKFKFKIIKNSFRSYITRNIRSVDITLSVVLGFLQGGRKSPIKLQTESNQQTVIKILIYSHLIADRLHKYDTVI